MMQVGRRTDDDQTGKWLGLGAFVLGVVLLIVVFAFAFGELTGGSIAALAEAGVRDMNANAVFASLLRGLFLFVMGYLASAIAGRGIGMYQASRGGSDAS